MFKVNFFPFQGFTELLPIDLIKIFDENELEVCILNTILCRFLNYLLLLCKSYLNVL
jgi:hypothetical protein